jgi:CheY-like chemotaxis protein
MSKKILLADDSITIQKVIELTFSDEDFDVVTVGNGRLALEKLPDVKPDIVLCDIIMPEADGYEVCQRVKSDPQTAHIPVLLLTGAFEPFDQERATRVGSDGFLAKPFEPETLITKVKDLLARAPARPAPPAPAARVEPPAPPPPPPTPVPAPPRAPSSFVAVPPSPRPSVESPRAAVRPSFIPEEPFDAFDAEAIEQQPAMSEGSEPELVPVTPEESATLTGAPEPAPGAGSADAASTVMFRPDDLPWAAATQRAAPPPAREAPAPPVEPEVELEPEPELPTVEPQMVAEPLESSEESDDRGEPAGGFEEVLEEDLEFGTGLPSEATTPGADPYGMETGSRPADAAPPLTSSEDETSTGRFRAPDFPSPSATETAPPLMALEPPESVPAPRVSPMEPPFGGERPPAAEPERWRPAPRPPVPEPSPPEMSFADVRADVAEPEPPTPPPSPAASAPVPVDMVEKIAQRVVAQVSEKVVREIAWEVFPDLAEALIKQEIERLKAELQKL